jgi:hypothetical protein
MVTKDDLLKQREEIDKKLAEIAAKEKADHIQKLANINQYVLDNYSIIRRFFDLVLEDNYSSNLIRNNYRGSYYESMLEFDIYVKEYSWSESNERV